MVHSFRYNNYDRAPLADLPAEAVEEFYEHLPVLTAAMQRPENAIFLRLAVGTMLVINNRRVMHGRRAFQGHRNLVGCYMDTDALYSAARLCNLIPL